MRPLLVLILLLGLFGCATHKPPPSPPPAPSKVVSEEKPPAPPSRETEEEPPAQEEEEERFISLSPPQQTRGLKLLPAKQETGSRKKTYDIAIDLENADLLEFLEALFSKTLNKNYVVDPTVRAKVTVHLNGRFTEAELIRLVSEILEMQNIGIVKSGSVYRITAIAKVGRLSESYSFAILKPQHILSDNLLPVVRAFVSPQATVISDKATGALVIVDTPSNLQKVIKIVSILDQNLLENFFLEIYRPKVLEAEKLADYLEKIFRSGVFRLTTPQNYVDFVPLKELNTLLILARDQESLETIKRWIVQLDQGETTERQVFVYYVENGDAEEIANVLQDAFSEVGESKRETVVRAEGGKKKTTTPKNKGGKTISGKVRIIPDKTNNLLVIAATPEDYRVILNLLKEIDIIPRQVLIEVLIAEVALNKNLEFGVEWWIKTNFNIDGRKYTGDIISTNKYEGQRPKGFSFTVYRGLEPRALLAALDEVSEVHILSSPVLLATDNKEAKIQVGEEVPTISQSVVNTSATVPNVTQNIQYRDVGIILGVKPHINSSGLVKLEVSQEISSVSDKTYQGVQSPVFTKRKIETSLVVQDGHTVIFGGLIQNQHGRVRSGVPFLKDLPVLGGLFRWEGSKNDRKELLVAITPRVVRTMEEAEEVMAKYRERIQELRVKLEREFQGSSRW